MDKPKWADKKVKGGWSWGQKEIDFIKSHAGKWPKNKIAEKLGRTSNATFACANKNGISLRLLRVTLLELKSIVKELNITSKEEYVHRRLPGMPRCPDKLKGWDGWPDLLGTKASWTPSNSSYQLGKALKHYADMAGTRAKLQNGSWVVHTGKVIKVGPDDRHFLYVPELRGEYCGHKFPAGQAYVARRNYPRRCSKCFIELGKIRYYKLWRNAWGCGLGLDDYRRLRDKHTNKKGLVCCGVCNLPENGRLLGLDHNQRFDKKDPTGHRALLHPDCNLTIENVESNFNLRHCSGIFTKYLNKWDKIILSNK